MLENITPVIITYNEEPNIGRTLEKLSWAKDIVVVDSFSDDRTVEILRQFSNVRVFQRAFDSFASQCNYALKQAATEWVLSLDADYILGDELVSEMRVLAPAENLAAYYARFKYCVFGKPLRSTLLPPRAILFRKNAGTYADDGHMQRLKLEGPEEFLKGYVYHDDRKAFCRWLKSQDTYARAEAKKLKQTPASELNLQDRVRQWRFAAPFLVLVYCLFCKGLIFDGWRGVYYSFQRLMAETILSLRLIEEDFSGRKEKEKS